MCQEEQSLSSEDTQDAILVACHVKNTTVLSQVRNRSSPGNNTCSEEHLESHLDLGPGVQSCGHAMHSKCYQKFFDSLIVKERERTRQNGYYFLSLSNNAKKKPNTRHTTSFLFNSSPFRAILNYDIQLHEYLCPICERLCNNVLPLMPPVFKIFEQAEPDTYSTFALWHDKMVRYEVKAVYR